MTGPILRIPLSEAEAHRAELAAAKARIATLEALAEMAAAPGLTASDVRDVLLDEANADDGVVRGCLEGDEPQEGDINVVDTICEMCSRLRHLTQEKAALQAERDGLAQDATFEAEQKEAEEAARDALVRKHAEAAARAGLDVEPIGNMGFIFEQIEAEWAKAKAPTPGVGDLFIAPEADRIAAVKAHLATKKPAPAPKPVDTRAHVATRRDAHGRRFWDGAGWTDNVVSARDCAPLDTETLAKLKPRGSRLVALDAVPALLAEDAAKDAAKKLANSDEMVAASMPEEAGGA